MAGWKYHIGAPAPGWQNLTYDDSAWTPAPRPSWGFGPDMPYAIEVDTAQDVYGRLPITIGSEAFDLVAWIDDMATTFYLDGDSRLVQVTFGTETSPGHWPITGTPGEHMLSFWSDPRPEGNTNGILKLYFGQTPIVAPPARLFPREDGLGVGGGRTYPPPKSQQRSPRRFGYY